MLSAKIYKPQYFKYFKCAGSGCEHNCCQGWEITIDKITCETYAALEDGALRKRLLDNIEIMDKEAVYARIKLDEDGKCPFINPDGLCELQLILGHDQLPAICRTYPRIFCGVAGELEALMTMSCEVTAKSALFNTGILALDESGSDSDAFRHLSGILDVSKYTEAENGTVIFWELRSAVIYILQNRRYPVWLRLVILGFFIKDADGLILAKREDGIPDLAEEFISRIEAGLYDGYLNSIPERPDIKISFIFAILYQIDKTGKSYRHLFHKCVRQMREGLSLEPGGVSVGEAVNTFSHVYKTFYAPFFKDQEYIFENYIANTVYMTGFPFVYNREGRLYDNYLRLVVKYALVKFLLIGMSGYHKQSFNGDTVVEGVIAFSRTFDHGPKLIDSIVEELEERNAATVGALCVLIKD